MALPWIVIGDTTTHGGKVLEGEPTFTVDDVPVAQVGHLVTCPRCKDGPFPIATGAPNFSVHGRALARHGDETACGARLISRQLRATWSSEGLDDLDNSSGLVGKQLEPYDERFLLKDADTGEIQSHTRYAIERANGVVEHGTTDAAGHTHLLSSELASENVVVYVAGAV